MGGFAFTANAQDEVKTATNQNTKTATNQSSTTTNGKDKTAPNVVVSVADEFTPMLKAFDKAVDECTEAYKEDPKNFETKLNAALKLRDELDKVAEKMTQSQKKEYDRINKKLKKVLTK